MMKNTFKLLPVLVATALLTACPSDDDDNTKIGRAHV